LDFRTMTNVLTMLHPLVHIFIKFLFDSHRNKEWKDTYKDLGIFLSTHKILKTPF
jgi:hypothetical protein